MNPILLYELMAQHGRTRSPGQPLCREHPHQGNATHSPQPEREFVLRDGRNVPTRSTDQARDGECFAEGCEIELANRVDQ